jgi:hypothetical protein
MSTPKPSPSVDLGYPTEAHGRIPSFANVEEEAAFWDTHDFTDFADESTPVQMTVGRDLIERRRQNLRPASSRP